MTLPIINVEAEMELAMDFEHTNLFALTEPPEQS